MNSEKRKEQKKAGKSKLPILAMNIVCIMLVCSVLFIFIVFRTDHVIKVENDMVKNSADFDRITSTTVITEIQQDESNPGSSGVIGIPPTPPPMPTPPGPSGGTQSVKQDVYNFLASLGYDDPAIAGIMGNMQEESGILYGTTQRHTHDGATNAECKSRGKCFGSGSGNAHGLVQWDTGRRQSLLTEAVKANVEWTDPAFQKLFLKNEIMGNYYSKWVSPANIYNNIPVGVSSVEYACYRWCRFFEVCSGVTNKSTYADRTKFSHWNKRLQSADAIYAEIQAGQLGKGATVK